MSGLASKERPIDGIRAAIVSQCDEALDRLARPAPTPKDIHEARKALKKARAWLRLLRNGTSTRSFREQNHALRDAARPLSEARDAQVLIETLDELLDRYHEPATDRRFGRFKRALQKNRRAVQREVMSTRTGIAASKRTLRRARKSLVDLPVEGADWKVIGASFEKVYAKGRKHLQAAEDACTAESLHEWRKDTKNLWHQLQMLEPLWPGVIEEWADQAHRLADYLGDDHDLWVLRKMITKRIDDFPKRADADALLALVDHRRERLQAKAWLLGARIYEPKPRRLRARLGKFWRLWK